MKRSILKNYAHLIAACGVNIQKGQDVVIQSSFDQIEFIRILIEECYKCGAKDVIVLWGDPKMAILNYKYRKLKDLCNLRDWEKTRWENWKENLPCRIYIESDDPTAMNKVNQKKFAATRKALLPQIRSYRDHMDGLYQWCIAGVPSVGWAKKVFPELSGKKAVEALWEAILKVSRAYEGDPIKNWEQHEKTLKEKSAKLNALDLAELHYTSKSTGTDFTVGLIKDVIWLGGGEEGLKSKILFQPNIPSEEIFTSPMRGKAEGIVYATKPLSYNGKLIDKFWMKFHEGKVVDFGAEVGQDLIKEIVEIDEGSAYLGECALIPFDSPINNTGLLFYSTLYDENASCHLAIGRGFETLMIGAENMTNEEIHAKGINKSGSHVDFMIGARDLQIEGTDRKGKKHLIFKEGNWAI